MTPAEHARVKTIPEQMIEGLSATRAHEVLGQSVVFCAFVAVGVLIAKSVSGLVAPIRNPQPVNREEKVASAKTPVQAISKHGVDTQVTLPLFALTA